MEKSTPLPNRKSQLLRHLVTAARSYTVVCILFSALLMSSVDLAVAGSRLLDCTDVFTQQADLDSIREMNRAMQSDAAFRPDLQGARKTAEEAIQEALKDVSLPPEAATLLGDLKNIVDGPIFNEALARTLSLSGIKKASAIAEFQVRLAASPENLQMEFANLVLRQYEHLLDQAFAWVDESRFKEVYLRWGLSEKEIYPLLRRWNLLHASNAGEVQLAALAWSKAITTESVLTQIKSLKRKGALALTDSDDVLITKIRLPHNDQDLAENRGPISDTIFSRRIRLWSAMGWAKDKVNMLRYPKEPAFVIGMSVGPVWLTHFFFKDWNLTNTVATVIGGIVTCPPLIAKLVRSATHQQHDAVWLDILTLRQLAEFKRWILAYPTRATELGFAGMEKSIDERILQLRQLRYGPEVSPNAN